jgi:hypothetical protein
MKVLEGAVDGFARIALGTNYGRRLEFDVFIFS